MQALSVRARYTTLLSAPLLLVLAACGCKLGVRPPPPACSCAGDIHIKVNHTHPRGVDKKAVYLCEGYKVFWEAESNNIQKFTVEFVGPDLPFGASTIFNSNSSIQANTPALPPLSEMTVFKYKITITDTSNQDHQFDPHIIGGG